MLRRLSGMRNEPVVPFEPALHYSVSVCPIIIHPHVQPRLPAAQARPKEVANQP
jgi:hypothetical protein